MLEVAVIGAGSAGLVAARHLLANGLRCCIFEATSTLGGAWSSSSLPPSSSSDDNNPKMMWNGLHTNLSKHTCRFSDFPWSSSELIPGSTPTFPSHIDMDRYLQSYADQYVDPSCFRYNCQVTNITPVTDTTADDDDEQNSGYRVEWTDTFSQTRHVQEFEGVVVTTGFFARPQFPPGFSPTSNEQSSSSSSSSSSPCQILHAQDYHSHEAFADETVAVVGSSFSALEIAVDVSQSAQRVVSILPNIPWVVPRYVPTSMNKLDGETTSTTTTATATTPGNDDRRNIFLPVDLAFYQRTAPAGSPATISLTPESCRQRHQYMNQWLGPRQEDILGLPRNFEAPPMVAISDYYLDLVADGTIQVIHGRAQGVDEAGLRVSTIVEDDEMDDRGKSGSTVVLPNISKIICCTGYLPDLQSYLDPSMLKTLEYDPEDMFSPLTACWQCLHPQLRNLAFCGMYRGSYMGVVEMQARLAAQLLSGKLTLTDEQYQRELKVSRMIREQNPRQQFPRFDYIGFMDSLADAMGGANGERLPKWNRQEGEIVTPAFYQHNDDIAKAGQEEIEEEIEKGRNGSHVPSIVMSALIGSWNFHRNIVHFTNNHRENVQGTIRYSRPKLDYVLYREDGLYQISEHKSLQVFREYEYVCQGDTLELYFVESGERAHLFLSLKFQEQTNDGYWVATSDHLCIKDLYKANFKIKLDGLKATELVNSYRVKGPEKDYEATTVMTPHVAAKALNPQL